MALTEVVRLSDYNQLLTMLIAIDVWFRKHHSGATGIHDQVYGVADFTGDADTGSSSVQSTTVAVGASAGDVKWTAPSWPARQHAFGNLSRLHTAGGAGLVELLPALQGSDFSTGSWQTGVIGCVGTRQLTSGSAAAGNFVCYHAPTWSPEVISPQALDYITTPTGAAPNGPYTKPFEQQSARQRFWSRDVYNGAYSRAVARSMYNQCWRLGTSLYNAILYEHDANGVSLSPSLMRLFGRSQMPGADASFAGAETFNASNLLKIGPHNGTFQYPLPYLRLTQQVGTPAADFRWLCLPAFDDKFAYIDIQPMGSTANTNATFQWALEACMIGDVLPSTGTLPALDMQVYAQLSHAIRNMEWRKIYDGLQLYKILFAQEHDFATGGHRFPLPRLKNATKVFDSSISAPGTIANMTYTPSSRSAGASNAGSYTNVTITQIDTLRSGGDVYLGSMKGNPGSGIASMSFATDGAHVYSIVRRKTAGTTNTFAQRVWRIDH